VHLHRHGEAEDLARPLVELTRRQAIEGLCARLRRSARVRCRVVVPVTAEREEERKGERGRSAAHSVMLAQDSMVESVGGAVRGISTVPTAPFFALPDCFRLPVSARILNWPVLMDEKFIWWP